MSGAAWYLTFRSGNKLKKTKNTLCRYSTVIMLGRWDTPQGPLGLMPTGGPMAAPSSPGDKKDKPERSPWFNFWEVSRGSVGGDGAGGELWSCGVTAGSEKTGGKVTEERQVLGSPTG